MPTRKEYAYYIKGNKVAIVQKDWTSSGGTEYAVDANTDMVFFKHTGLLFGTTDAAAAADTVKVGIHGDDTTGVSGDAVFVAEILNGEAFLLPRPAFGITWKLASGDNAVGVEVLILST